MPIHGSSLKIQNSRLRMLLILFIGVLAFGAVMYWRTTLLDPTRYLSIPNHTKIINSELKSQNFQLEVQDSSPTVK